MNSNNLINIEQDIDNLNKQYKSALVDFKKYYVLVETEPKNSEYNNFFNGIKAELQHYSQRLVNITQDIIIKLRDMEKNVIDKSNKLENQKKIYNKMMKMYKELEQKQNGSNLFINDSKELYNEQYYKNAHLFVGIIVLISTLVYLAKKKT